MFVQVVPPSLLGFEMENIFERTHQRQTLSVAIVSRRVHPAHGPGGLERHVFELIKYLASSGVKIELFSETPTDKLRKIEAESLLPDGVSFNWVYGHRIPLGNRKGTVVFDRITNYPIWALEVARRLAKRVEAGGQWDVIHVHGLAGLGFACGFAGDVSRNMPLILTTHGMEEFRSHVKLKHWAYSPFRSGMRTIAAKSDALVTTDKSLVKLVNEYLRTAQQKQVVIPNAVDPEVIRRLGNRSRGMELVSQFGLKDASPLFLSVGRIEINKGFDVLVSALAEAALQLPESWAWILVGTGPEAGNIERAVKHEGLMNRVVMAGQLSDCDLHSLYSIADWFVHPTLYEGSSLVTLEAMAHALPVIASETGGLPDKVVDGQTGFLVPPGDKAALSEALIKAVSCEVSLFGKAGRRLCEEQFSWNVVVPQYIALYKRMIALRGPVIQ